MRRCLLWSSTHVCCGAGPEKAGSAICAGPTAEAYLRGPRTRLSMARQPPLRASQRVPRMSEDLRLVQAPEQELEAPGSMAAIGETAIDEGRQQPQM